MLQWIYPHLCALCHSPGEQELCPDCAAGLKRVPLPICLYCGSSVAGEQEDPYHCRECKGRARSFDFARSALCNTEQSLYLVHKLKYHHANYLAPALAEFLSEVWDDTPALDSAEDWGIVPVPSGKTHLFLRGFNQAEELARSLGKLRGLRVYEPLQRIFSNDDSQTRLSATARWRNALQSYKLTESYASGRRALPERLVLVDDVYTTGATVRACAHALKQLPEVKKVGVLTVMRAARG